MKVYMVKKVILTIHIKPVKVLVVPTDEEVMISRDVIKYGKLNDNTPKKKNLIPTKVSK